MCTQQFCEQGSVAAPPGEQGTSDAPSPGESMPPASSAIEGATPSSGITCDNVRCMAGTHCEMVQVQCVRAPCDPVPECKPDAP
jgi:hypothetical protein